MVLLVFNAQSSSTVISRRYKHDDHDDDNNDNNDDNNNNDDDEVDDDDDDDDDDNDDSIEKRNSRFLQSPHCATNRLQIVRSSGQIVCQSRATHGVFSTCSMSCVNHVQHMECLARAAYRVPITCNTWSV